MFSFFISELFSSFQYIQIPSVHFFHFRAVRQASLFFLTVYFTFSLSALKKRKKKEITFAKFLKFPQRDCLVGIND